MADDDIAALIELELTLMSPGIRSSPAQVGELLEPGFREIGASGRLWTRSEVVQALARAGPEDKTTVEVTEMQATVLGSDLVLLTYVSTRGERRARRSSVWRRSESRWRLVFHQGTLL